MIKPPLLKPGDKVGIAAPARKVRPDDIALAVQILVTWGLDVIPGKNLFSEHHGYLAGLDEERLSDFQSMVDDASMKAIFCARGGYGSTRIIDQLDFDSLSTNPKWIIGFSDITSLHLKLNEAGIQSIHGTMPLLFSKPEAAQSVESLRELVFSGRARLTSPANSYNRGGEVQGEVLGGNLSLLVDALGTRTEPDTTNKILVIEEIDEYLYKIDRMLQHLKRAGKFNDLAGLVVGHMTDIKDTELKFGESIEALILNAVREYSFPIAFNVPTGHQDPNLAWIEGGLAHFRVSSGGLSLEFH